MVNMKSCEFHTSFSLFAAYSAGVVITLANTFHDARPIRAVLWIAAAFPIGIVFAAFHDAHREPHALARAVAGLAGTFRIGKVVDYFVSRAADFTILNRTPLFYLVFRFTLLRAEVSAAIYAAFESLQRLVTTGTVNRDFRFSTDFSRCLPSEFVGTFRRARFRSAMLFCCLIFSLADRACFRYL